jgi:hypothetical protein
MASSRDKIRVLANGDILPSATLDRFQERTLQSPFTVSSGSPANFDTAFATWNGTIATDGEQQGPGSYDRMGCSLYNGTGISNNNLVILDDTIDWRGRLLSIELLVTTDATTMPGGANAHLFGTSSLVALSATAVNSPLYTNGGATNSGTGNNPVAGSPPTRGPRARPRGSSSGS